MDVEKGRGAVAAAAAEGDGGGHHGDGCRGRSNCYEKRGEMILYGVAVSFFLFVWCRKIAFSNVVTVQHRVAETNHDICDMSRHVGRHLPLRFG